MWCKLPSLNVVGVNLIDKKCFNDIVIVMIISNTRFLFWQHVCENVAILFSKVSRSAALAAKWTHNLGLGFSQEKHST